VVSLEAFSTHSVSEADGELWREAGNLEELELPPSASEVAERRRKKEDKKGLNYESNEHGKLLENGFDANDNDDNENENNIGGGDQKGKKAMPA